MKLLLVILFLTAFRAERCGEAIPLLQVTVYDYRFNEYDSSSHKIVTERARAFNKFVEKPIQLYKLK